MPAGSLSGSNLNRWFLSCRINNMTPEPLQQEFYKSQDINNLWERWDGCDSGNVCADLISPYIKEGYLPIHVWVGSRC